MNKNEKVTQDASHLLLYFMSVLLVFVVEKTMVGETFTFGVGSRFVLNSNGVKVQHNKSKALQLPLEQKLIVFEIIFMTTDYSLYLGGKLR